MYSNAILNLPLSACAWVVIELGCRSDSHHQCIMHHLLYTIDTNHEGEDEKEKGFEREQCGHTRCARYFFSFFHSKLIFLFMARTDAEGAPSFFTFYTTTRERISRWHSMRRGKLPFSSYSVSFHVTRRESPSLSFLSSFHAAREEISLLVRVLSSCHATRTPSSCFLVFPCSE